MIIYCDIFTPLGESIGDGPIANIIYARITDRMDLDGEFYFEMPAAHPLAQYVTAKRVAKLYQRTSAGRVDLGNGEIESVETIIRQDQPPLLAVRGSGQLRELALAVIPQGTAYTDSDEIPLDIVSNYASDIYLVDGWVLTGRIKTARAISTTFTGTNVLEALINLAETTGEHFRRGTRDREVVWIGGALDLEDSGITATTQPYGTNPLLCRILNIRQTLDGYEIFNRIHPYGGGTEGDNLIDASSADTWPDSEAITSDPETHNLGGSLWTLDKASNLLTNDASVSAYGPRAKALTLTNIPAEEGATDADISNMVLQSAYNWARTRGDVAEYYEIKIADCAQILLTGQTIRVIAKWSRDGRMPIDIDKTLYILEVVNETTALGVVTAQIFASTVDRWNETAEDMLLDAVVGTSVSAASIVGVGHSHSQYMLESALTGNYASNTARIDSMESSSAAQTLSAVASGSSATVYAALDSRVIGNYAVFSLGASSAEIRRITALSNGDRTMTLHAALSGSHAAGGRVEIRRAPVIYDTDFGSTFTESQIQAAIDEADASGIKDVRLGSKEYLISNTIDVLNHVGLRVGGVSGADQTTASTVLRWKGDAIDPMILIDDSRNCIFSDFHIVCDSSDPLAVGVKSVNGSGSGGYTTRNQWHSIVATGTSLASLGIGWQFAVGGGGDAGNDQNSWYDCSVAHYASAAWSFEHTQSKAHVLYNCTFYAEFGGDYGVSSGLGSGGEGGSFSWYGGFGHATTEADFYIGVHTDTIAVSDFMSEESARLLACNGSVETPGPVTLDNIRWACVTHLASDKRAVDFTHSGPLSMRGIRFETDSDDAMQIRVASTDAATYASIIGCAIQTNLTQPVINNGNGRVDVVGCLRENTTGSFDIEPLGVVWGGRSTTLGASDTTPSVAGERDYFTASNSSATTITDFDDGYDGQEIAILFDQSTASTTIANNANIKTKAGANLTPADATVYRFVQVAAVWREL